MIGLGILRCFFLGTLMIWYTASVWQTVDRYFRDQFKDYLEKEYEENEEIKKDVLMEAQREAAKKALIEKMAKIEFNKVLDGREAMAQKKHRMRHRRPEEAGLREERVTVSVQEEESEVCREEDDGGGTCGSVVTQEGATMVAEEGLVLLNEGIGPMSETELGALENEGGWARGSEAEAGTGWTADEETLAESSAGTEDNGRNSEAERIIAEMQRELGTESNFDAWEPDGECEGGVSVQEECRLEDFAGGFKEGWGDGETKWCSAFDEDEGEMCLIDIAEKRGLCSNDVDFEGEGVVIKRPFGN